MNKYKAESRRAQKQRKKNRMCSQKTRYETQETAYQKGQRVYQCPHCKGWHRSGKLAELTAIVKKKP